MNRRLGCIHLTSRSVFPDARHFDTCRMQRLYLLDAEGRLYLQMRRYTDFLIDESWLHVTMMSKSFGPGLLAEGSCE